MAKTTTPKTTNVRTRPGVSDETLAAFVSLCERHTMRSAWARLREAGHIVSWDAIENACRKNPEWDERRKAATALRVARLESQLEELPMRLADGTLSERGYAVEHTRIAWTLGKVAREDYGDRRAVETSGPNGGPVELSTKAEVVRYELRVPVSPMLLEDDESGPTDDSSDP